MTRTEVTQASSYRGRAGGYNVDENLPAATNR